MVNTVNYKAFVEDKINFFSKVDSIDSATKEAEAHNFVFLSNNENFLNEEFLSIYTNLQNTKHRKQDFILYCYYCCLMLENYYDAYGQSANRKKYEQLKLQLQAMYEKKEPSLEQYDSFFTDLGKKILAALQDLIATPVHTSKIKNQIGFLNLCRIYWIFDQLIIVNGLTLLQKSQILDQIDKIFGKTINVDKVIKTFEVPAEIFRALSVGFFAARFIINATLTLKHTFFPHGIENELSLTKRLSKQIKKRYPEFLNDGVWAIFNISNYGSYLYIAPPVAGLITVVGLTFDISLLLWLRESAKKDYLTKKSKYAYEKALCREKINATITPLSIRKENAYYEMLEKQEIELDNKWQILDSTFWFKITAAIFLAAGFTASMLFAPGILVLASYSACLLGVAMFLSTDNYAAYKEKSVKLQHISVINGDDAKAKAEHNQALLNFALIMLKNIVFPTLVIAAFIVAWQAAAIVCTAYLVIEFGLALYNHASNKPVPPAAQQEGDIHLEEPSIFDNQNVDNLIPTFV